MTKDLGNIHFSLYFSLSLIQRKGNKRLYLSVENLKEVLNDQRELKIKCYGSVAIRVKPLVNGTSTRLSKAQTISSLLTPGKTLTDATAPMHGIFLTICNTFIVIRAH